MDPAAQRRAIEIVEGGGWQIHAAMAPPERQTAIEQAAEFWFGERDKWGRVVRRWYGPALPLALHGTIGDEVAVVPDTYIGAAMVLGVSPAECCPELSRAEAAEFCSQGGHKTELEWLSVRAGISGARSIAVARWAIDVIRDPDRKFAFDRDRPGGAVRARLDELEPADLCRSVADTIARASARADLAAWDGPAILVERAEWEDRLPPGVHRLRTYSALCAEAHAMRHCVRQYADRVRAGTSVIMSITSDGHRSTADIDVHSREIIQHVGPENRAPHQSCVTLLDRAIAGLR